MSEIVGVQWLLEILQIHDLEDVFPNEIVPFLFFHETFMTTRGHDCKRYTNVCIYIYNILSIHLGTARNTSNSHLF